MNAIIILRETATCERLNGLADELHWEEVADVVRGHFVLASKRWSDPAGTTIEYFEDHTSDARYVAVEGHAADAVAASIRDTLPHFDEDELLRELEGNDDPIAWIRGLGRLCVLRPTEPDPRYVSLWYRGLTHPQRAARRAAIRTAYGCRWPELLDVVRKRLGEEYELKEPLEHLLAYLERDDE
jgi:hypothetical protein